MKRIRTEDAAERLCALTVNENMNRSEPKEGKIEFSAALPVRISWTERENRKARCALHIWLSCRIADEGIRTGHVGLVYVAGFDGRI